jgi:preprotein translocase subunit SecF
MLDLLKYRYAYLLISALIMIPGVIFLALGGLRPGIDFRGGTELTVVLPAGVRPSTGDVERLVATVSYTEQGHTVRLDDAHVQQVRDQRSPDRQAYLIRTHDIGANVAAQSRLLAALKARYGAVESLGFTTVSGTVAADTATRAVQAVLLAAGAILLYMAWAFRKLPHPFVYGGAAIAALLHDVVVVLGLFAIAGYFFNVRIDALFVPAVLTVIGFSVHDTIVVFDRVRENLGRRSGESYYAVVNGALAQTLGRSLSTSLTVLLTLVALVLFGGASIRMFVLTLLIGIASGTYSSIFTATPLAVLWETGELSRLWRRSTRRGARAPRPRPSENAGTAP